QRAFVGALETDDALHQRALAGAVLAQQRMKAAGGDLDRDILERGKGAEALGHVQALDLERRLWRCGRRGNQHAATAIAGATASSSAAEFATAPKTPPCIF